MNAGNKNKRKVDMRKIANRQHANLLGVSVDIGHAVTIFERLKCNEFTSGTVKHDNWLKEILKVFIIIKLYAIFDKHNSALSLEGFLKKNACHITNRENIKDIDNRLENIKKSYQLLIIQIAYNRHENGHIPQKSKLGVTKEVADKIKEIGKMTGNKEYENQESVADEYMRFSVGNFPIDKVGKLTKELSRLIMGILYPKTLEIRSS